MSIDELDDLDPTKPSLVAMGDAGHAFSIPWSHNGEVRALMAGFDSARMRELSGPWVLLSPFDLHGTKLSALIPDDTSGGIGSFRDGFSTTSGSSNEHLSAALGITVGYPFLNASVTGEYDKTVIQNETVGYPPAFQLLS